MTWLFAILGLLSIFGNLAILVFLFTRYSKYPKPTLLAILAFGLMILSTVVQWGMSIALPRLFDSDTYLIVTLLLNFLSTLGHFGAMLLLVVAIYTDRVAKAPKAVDAPIGRSTMTSENPYSPPENH